MRSDAPRQRTDDRFVFDPYDTALIDDPYPTYRTLRDHHPVYHNASRDIWAISRFDDVQEASRDWQRFSSADGVGLRAADQARIGTNLIGSDPPRHDELRKLMRSDFTPRATALLEPMVRHLTRQIISALPSGEPIDAIQAIAWRLPLMVIGKVLEIPDGDLPSLGDLLWTSELLRNPGDPDPPPESVDASASLRRYFADLLARRRRKPGQDPISRIGAALPASADDLADDAIGACNVLFMAGVDSPADAIGVTLMLLARFPEQRAALRAAPAQLPAAIEEAIRYETPVQNQGRTTTEAVELHGVRIPQGARVALVYGAANRDERQFADPDRFDIAREPKRHLGFGEGIHFCLGAPLARLEARVILEVMLDHAPDWECPGHTVWLPKYNQRGLARLDLVV